MSHLKDENLSWNRHRHFAWGVSLKCLKCATIAFVHGVLPFIWVHTTSNEIRNLNTLLDTGDKLE